LIRKLYKCSWATISSQGKTYKITIDGKNAKNNLYGKQLSLIVGDNCYIMNINGIKYGLVNPGTQQIDEENSKHCDLNGAAPIYKTEIIVTLVGGSDRSLLNSGIAKVGAIENDSILNFREIDPNIHVSYFIYEKQYSRPEPSVFVLYKNQVIKKAFLKKENTIEII
jgi:hypothetical protein